MIAGTELLSVSFKNLRRQGTRTILTLLGIVIGVAAIVALSSVGNGLNEAVQKQFEGLGTNTITVLPGKAFAESTFAKLKNSDAETIESVGGVKDAAEIFISVKTIMFGDENKSRMAIGVDPAKVENLGAVGLLNIEEGRNINKSDYLGIIIGNKISTDTFKRPVRLGQKIVMGDKTLRVVGINGKAMHSFGAIFNNAIIMNSRALKDIDQNLSPARIIVTAVEGADLEKLKSDIKAKLKKDHGSEDFQVLTMSQIGETATSVIGIITLVIMGIAAISLVVGGIGIMNTMLMAVMERTREIGVMKAIGATNNRILSIFLAESAIIGIIGGVIGVAVGAAIGFAVFAVSEAIGMPIYTMTSLPVALGAIAFAMAVGIIAGIVPARRAARLDAVEALRYE